MTEEDVLGELRDGEDDLEYYTLLNVDKSAGGEEIRRAYRRLCKIYHPDRYQDEQKQKIATEFFSRIQEAYNVLNDPILRLIYDKRGKKGLEDDLAIVQRVSIPSELLEEYEKMKELWEERVYIQNSNPTGNFRMELDATRLVDGHDDIEDEPFISLKKCSVEQSVSAAISKSALGQITGFLSAQAEKPLFPFSLGTSQLGFNGGINFSLRHMLSNPNWVKFSALLSHKPLFSVDAYHTLGNRMHVTANSSIVISNNSLRGSANASLTRRLTDFTLGTIAINLLGYGTSFKIIHQLSTITTLSGEANVNEKESFLKGVLHYHPLPKYIIKAGVKVGTSGMDIMYGIEHEIAIMTSVSASVLLGPSEGVIMKLKLSRAYMNFSIKVHLSEFVGLVPLFYATSIPLALYGCVKTLAFAPLIRKEWLEDIKEKRQEKSKEVAEKRSRAEAAVELMEETMQRIVNTEQAKHGLLIVEAWYGKLFDYESDKEQVEPKVVDVRVPLQCLVMESKLILHDTSKANIPGFYDPCIGEKKHLRVRYEFRGKPHEVTVNNSEPLVIPRISHRVINMDNYL